MTLPQTRLSHMSLHHAALALPLALALVGSVGCPIKVEGSAEMPAEQFIEIIKTAQKKDEAAFDQHLSAGFHRFIAQAEKLAEKKPELRGAFTSQKFMTAFQQMPPRPRLEKVQSGKAIILAADGAGQPNKYPMVIENGVWKLSPPIELVQQLAHFASLIDAPAPTSQPAEEADPHGTKPNPQKQALDDALKRADIALRQRDPVGAQQALGEAMAIFPDDVRALVAQARILVQEGQVKEAVAKFDAVQKIHKNHMPAFHYGGMAHIMDGNPAGAVKNWAYIQQADPEYFLANSLAGRLMVARKQAGETAPTDAPPPSPGAPASQPAP